MSPVSREYQSEFVQHDTAQGRAESMVETILRLLTERSGPRGDAMLMRIQQSCARIEGQQKGRAEIILRLLTLRFGPLTESIQMRVREACARESESMYDSLLTAKTLEEALATL